MPSTSGKKIRVNPNHKSALGRSVALIYRSCSGRLFDLWCVIYNMQSVEKNCSNISEEHKTLFFLSCWSVSIWKQGEWVFGSNTCWGFPKETSELVEELFLPASFSNILTMKLLLGHKLNHLFPVHPLVLPRFPRKRSGVYCCEVIVTFTCCPV